MAPNQPPEAFKLTVPHPWVTGGIVHGISQTTSLPNWLICVWYLSQPQNMVMRAESALGISGSMLQSHAA